MKHPSCREIYDYWTRIKGTEPAPRRGDVEPAILRAVLRDTFILEVAEGDIYRYRLAGTRICSAYCRELKGRNFLDEFGDADRGRLAPMLASTTTRAMPILTQLTGWTARGFRLEFEMVLLPLRHSGLRYDRILGAMAPMEQPYWLGTLPVVGQEITGLRFIAERRPGRAAPDFRPLAPVPPRPIPKGRPALVLLDGGKSSKEARIPPSVLR